MAFILFLLLLVLMNIYPCKSETELPTIAETDESKYNFVVALLNHEKEFVCAGSIIEQGLIVTAAHCVSPSLSYVLINSRNVSSDDLNVTNKKEPLFVRIVKFDTISAHGGDRNATSNVTRELVGVVVTEEINTIMPTVSFNMQESIKFTPNFTAVGYGINNSSKTYFTESANCLNFLHDETGEMLHGYTDIAEIINNETVNHKFDGGAALLNGELIGVIVRSEIEYKARNDEDQTQFVDPLFLKILPNFVFREVLYKQLLSTHNLDFDYHSNNTFRKTHYRRTRAIEIPTGADADYIKKALCGTYSTKLESVNLLTLFIAAVIYDY